MDERTRTIGVARLQRTLLRLVGAFVLLLTAFVWSLRAGADWVAFASAWSLFGVILAIWIAEVMLQAAVRWHWFQILLHVSWPIGAAVLCASLGLANVLPGIIPIFILIDAVMVNGRVNYLLKNAGVRVGLMGASNDELRRLQTGVCFHCGYDMAGLPTPVCPECGKESRIGVSQG